MTHAEMEKLDTLFQDMEDYGQERTIILYKNKIDTSGLFMNLITVAGFFGFAFLSSGGDFWMAVIVAAICASALTWRVVDRKIRIRNNRIVVTNEDEFEYPGSNTFLHQ